MAKKKTTIGVEPELQVRLENEGKKIGVGWTTMLLILAREALAQREKVGA